MNQKLDKFLQVLKLSNKSLKETKTEKIVNLLANDASRFDTLFSMHYAWLVFFQIPMTLYLMWIQMGVSSLSGMACLILLAVLFQGNLQNCIF